MELRSYIKRASYFIGVIFSLALVGCGGGGGGSAPSSSLAAVTEANARGFSVGAFESAKVSGAYSEAEIVVEQIFDRFLALDDSLFQDFIDNVNIPCLNGGSLQFVDGDIGSSSISGSIIFNNCIEVADLIDGRFDFSITGISVSQSSGDLSFSLASATYNLTIDFLNSQPVDVFNVTGSGSCRNDITNCEYSETITADGITYTIEDAVVSSVSNVYDITAGLTHENFGSVDIVATDITYCTDGRIESGNILAFDSTGDAVLTINFASCDEFTAIFNGGSPIVIPQT